ncbi:MAG: hypothetical protein ABI647_27180 [Gemmatimonadota bacterium]
MFTRRNVFLALIGIGAGTTEDVLSAGSPQLVTAHLTSATLEIHNSVRVAPDSAIKPGGTQQLVLEEVPAPAAPGTMRVIHHSGTTTNYFIDTLVFKRVGLAPIWEHLYQVSTTRNRKMTRMITYHGTSAEVVTQSNDSAARTDTIRFVAPPFGFNQLEQVLQSVPHREGYHAVVALYSEGDNAQELDTISVLGRSSDGKGWKVRFADRVFSAVYVVDATTRHLLSSESKAQKPGPMVAYSEITTSSPKP